MILACGVGWKALTTQLLGFRFSIYHLLCFAALVIPKPIGQA
jgi:hypothetical protein